MNGIFAAATAAVIVSLMAGASAAEKTWRFDAVSSETRPDSKAMAAFAQEVTEKSNGKLEIKAFFGESLGIAAADTLRAVKSGAVEVAKLYAPYYARDVPDLALALVQGATLTQQENIDITPTVREIYREAYESAWNTKIVAWSMVPAYDTYLFCREPVNTLEDLKSRKVRVFSRDQVETFKRLGVSAQIVPQADLYVALQTGVIDCAVHLLGLVKSVSLQEVVKYGAYLFPFGQTPQAVAVNQAAWEELDEETKAVVIAAGETLWENSKAQALDTSFGEAEMAEFKANGSITFLEAFSEEDRKAIYQAAVDAWKEDAEKVGGRALEYREQVVKVLEESRK